MTDAFDQPRAGGSDRLSARSSGTVRVVGAGLLGASIGHALVALGVDGHRFGFPLPRRGDRARVDRLLEAVGAGDYADRRVGELSGGEQQRLRVGQALADDPPLLLCDEPLTSLDLANQRAVIGLIDRHRRATDAAVLFVTHDINPVLDRVDRILYIANGRFSPGPASTAPPSTCSRPADASSSWARPTPKSTTTTTTRSAHELG